MKQWEGCFSVNAEHSACPYHKNLSVCVLQLYSDFLPAAPISLASHVDLTEFHCRVLVPIAWRVSFTIWSRSCVRTWAHPMQPCGLTFYCAKNLFSSSLNRVNHQSGWKVWHAEPFSAGHTDNDKIGFDPFRLSLAFLYLTWWAFFSWSHWQWQDRIWSF